MNLTAVASGTPSTISSQACERAAVRRYEDLSAGPLAGLRTALLHGRLSGRVRRRAQDLTGPPGPGDRAAAGPAEKGGGVAA